MLISENDVHVHVTNWSSWQLYNISLRANHTEFYVTPEDL